LNCPSCRASHDREQRHDRYCYTTYISFAYHTILFCCLFVCCDQFLYDRKLCVWTP
jgi:hypothetical protein